VYAHRVPGQAGRLRRRLQRGPNSHVLVRPARDWLTLGTDYFGGTPAHHDWGTFQVTHAARVDGLWLPLAAFHKSGTTASPGVGEHEYTVTAARLGAVQEADLDVPFPPGSVVSDTVHHTRYRLEPDGSETPFPRGRNPG
jgi:hypothetical protein